MCRARQQGSGSREESATDHMAGKGRPPICVYMAREMLINVSEGEECRIALMENGRLEEFYIERTSATSHVGNIYKGRVVNVEPSIQAAFIDFGLGRNGFLHISDLLPSYFGRKGEDVTETVGRKLARRDRPPIQRCLRRGDEIIVQIIKEGIGTKGPTLTTYLSIPGRILVMMPGMSKMGVSRKIEDETERRRLRQILDAQEPPEECGFIIRTAGIGRTKADIQRDLAYLTRLWRQINKKIESVSGPTELYTEGDLVTRTVRDVFSAEIDAIVVDNAKVAEEVREFVKLTSPKAKDKVQYYDAPLPLFHKYNIEKDIEMMYSRHVPLPSGGSLVIDQTEAVVAIDVNSGKFRDHSDAETTAFKTDMEAAEEIPRQLKMRDLGGVIICDFIDLRYERHRRELEKKLHDNFKNDRAKTKVLRMSQFGIIELTRQRMRPSVKRSIYCDCPHCRGSGLVKTPESMSLDVMRRLAIATHDQRVVRIELTVHGDVAFYLNNRKRRSMAQLEAQTGKRIIIKVDAKLGLDEVRFELFDARDGVVMMPELLSQTPQTIQEAQTMAKQARQPDRGDRRDRRGRQERPERHPKVEEEEERFGRDEFDEPEQQGQGDTTSEPRGEEISGHDEESREEPAGETSESLDVDGLGAAPEPIDADEPSVPSDESADAELDEPTDELSEESSDASRSSGPSGRSEPELSEGPEEDLIDEPQELGEAPGEYIDEDAPRRDYRRDGRDQRRDQQQGRRGSAQSPPQPQRPPQAQGQPPAPRALPPRQRPPQGVPVWQGDQNRRQGGGFDQEGAGRGRRRGRRGGRGRGQGGDQGAGHFQPQRDYDRGNVRTPRDDDRPRGLPSNIWIQMPEDNKPEQAPQPGQPQQPQAPAAPAPQASVTKPVAAPVPRPVVPVQPPAPPKPAVPVAAAPIADWPQEQPVIRKRPPILTPNPADQETSKKRGGKKTAAKKVDEKKSAKDKKATGKSRSKKKLAVDDADVNGGPVGDEPPVRIAPIADGDAIVRVAGDKHLATDEPVDPDAIRRVNTRRDLDHVPEEIE